MLASLAFASTACEGDDGRAGAAGEDGDPGLGRADDLPGVVVTITALDGATGPGGTFRSGDFITVRFTIEDDEGEALELSEFDRGAIMVSGPSFNYQRVIESQSDLREGSKRQADGSYAYRFPVAIPDAYLPPLNDTDALTIGELTGQPLLAGTYTVGIEARKDYEIEGETFRDPGNATFDFLFGGASTLEPRQVVSQANCNQCHGDLSVHGSNRTRVENCLLCHTSGAEDRNVAAVEGGTPGVSIDFKVMIHKIHSGKHLPSVLGVTTNDDGTRDYDADPRPYRLVGFNDSVHDYSEVGFPVWPSLESPMPRDAEHGTLGDDERDLEDVMRSGPVDCDSCHGDPDGAGPLTAPAQGDLIFSQPSRAACGSCHDDVRWDESYRANQATMPPQLDDADCRRCHKAAGAPLDIRDAHLHPLKNPALSEGVNFDLKVVADAGANDDNDGKIDRGEKIAVTFTIKDDAGVDIDPTDLSRFEVVVSGPTSNPNLLHFSAVPTAGLGPGPTYTMTLPDQIYFERVGVSNAGNLQVFGTALVPHWNVAGAETVVWLRAVTPSGGASSLLSAVTPSQNYIDVQPNDGANFARDEYVVLEDGVSGQEEYLQIQWVDGDRLWFSSPRTAEYPPGPRITHPAGSSIAVVTLAAIDADDYTLDPLAGTFTEDSEFGDGVVLVTYTTDFVVPSFYAGTLNDSPDLDASFGDWAGLNIVDGTYTVGLWASRTFTVDVLAQTTSYREASRPATLDFLVGDADAIEPATRISSPQNCYACHQDIQFHGGGRRGYEACALCHTIAGAEDRPRYVAANAPDTTGVTIDFRSMLHKIHHGRELDNADSYQVIGFGVGYPDNYSAHGYGDVGFPAMPGGTRRCATCHGADNTAWIVPADRDHPDQTSPTRSWFVACTSCHDANAEIAHAASNTDPDVGESCAFCHGPGKEEPVEVVHKAR